MSGGPYRDIEKKRATGLRYSRSEKAKKRTRGYLLKKRYDMTVGEYESKLASQGGVCGICRRPPKNQRLHVDHNHRTHEVRGILCFRCNKGLGFFSNLGTDGGKRIAEYLHLTLTGL